MESNRKRVFLNRKEDTYFMFFETKTGAGATFFERTRKKRANKYFYFWKLMMHLCSRYRKYIYDSPGLFDKQRRVNAKYSYWK